MQPRVLTLTGWLVLFLLLYLFSKSNMGYKLIYYTLVLILLFLLLNRYQQIQNTLTKPRGA